MDVGSVLIAVAMLTGEFLLLLGGTVWFLGRFHGSADRSGAANARTAGPWYPPPVHQVFRVIVVMDIERFGRDGWDDEIRVRSVQALRGALNEALTGAGIAPEHWSAGSTGDGLLVAVDSEAGTANVLRALLDRLVAGLATRNRLMTDDARMRLRVVLHAGHVMIDGHTIIGEQVNHAFRLLEAEGLRWQLRHSPEPAVVAVSQHVFEQVVSQRALGLDPARFEPLLAEVKETSASAWVHAPGGLLSARAGDLSVPAWLPERAS